MEGFPNPLAFLTTFILLVILTNIPCLAATKTSTTPTSTCPIDFIRDSCRATKYPKLCYNSLSAYASKILTNEKLLTRTAFSMTLSDIILASSKLHKLSKNPSLRAAEVKALQDCIHKLKEAENKLRKGLREMGSRVENPNFQTRVMDLKKLLNSAAADVNHCKDVIVGNAVHKIVRAVADHHILHVIQEASIAMELLNKYANKHN